jgi:pro-apoptotic serine protease NMA111
MASNGDATSRCKQCPVSFVDQPVKNLEPEASVLTPEDATPQNESVYNVEDEISGAPLLTPLSPIMDSPEWQATIENVVKSVVAIHFCQTCSFDTDLSMSSQATGFVVDAKMGYIMTNRHVVCAGPFWGYCIFDNHEEVGTWSRERLYFG